MIVVCSLVLTVVEKNNGDVVAVVVVVVEGKQWKCGGGGRALRQYLDTIFQTMHDMYI